jgi:hypothetical protein
MDKIATLEVMRKFYIPEVRENNSTSNQEINIQICIDRYTLIDDAVIYYVRLRDLNSHEEWVYKARYRELRLLHDALTEAKIKNLPNFPKKKLFGMTNENPDDIERRREELEKYFNDIFNVKEILNSEPIRYFIEESKK